MTAEMGPSEDTWRWPAGLFRTLNTTSPGLHFYRLVNADILPMLTRGPLPAQKW